MKAYVRINIEQEFYEELAALKKQQEEIAQQPQTWTEFLMSLEDCAGLKVVEKQKKGK